MTAHAARSAFVLLALALAGSSVPGAQTVPTSSAPQAPRTGMIAGQVIDGTTGQPVPHAVVVMTMPRVTQTLPTTPRGRVITDEEGRYFFADLPAGEYYLSASLDGYVLGTYGQRLLTMRGGLLTLREGEKQLDVPLRVWKYGVIGGTVVDEAGEPVVGIAVRALLRDVVAGRTQFGSESYLVPTGTTDDRGVFRLARVTPGTYVVVVPSMHTTVPVSVMNGWDSGTMRTELFWAGMYEVSPLGHPRTQQIGDHALMSLNTVVIPPPVSANGRLSMYRTTFYPSAISAGTATAVTVGAGEERTDLAITLRPAPAARVSGRLVTPDGTPPPITSLKLIGDARSDVVMPSRPSSTAEVGLETAIGVSDPAGRFTLLGVPPGEYALVHADSFLMRAVRDGRPAYWLNQRISVGTADLQDLVVELRPALRVEGRFAVRGATGPVPPAIAGAGLAFETPTANPDQFFAEVRNGEFAMVAAGGRYIASPRETGGWFVDSVTLDGKDVTDRPFDLQSDATSIVVTYMDQPSKITGTVKDARGAASATAVVLAFPIDPQRWSGYGRSPRFVRSVSASVTGGYTFDHLPPGDYYVIAIDAAEADGWRDPKVLQVLSNRAERITVGTRDPARTLDLSVRAVR